MQDFANKLKKLEARLVKKKLELKTVERSISRINSQIMELNFRKEHQDKLKPEKIPENFQKKTGKKQKVEEEIPPKTSSYIERLFD